MLCGQAVVAIWNGITDVGRADFYDWHLREHMPERVGIPGFRRGRRYRALDETTQPEFFTLYEVDSFEVLQGQDYANRLNAPTPWTKRATSQFKDTFRGLARVLSSNGSGSGGALATIRFDVAEAQEQEAVDNLADLVRGLARLPLMTGAHLCRTDDDASGVKTAESTARTDIQAAPRWFVLLEACALESLSDPVQKVTSDSNVRSFAVGRYVHEFTRLKTDWWAG